LNAAALARASAIRAAFSSSEVADGATPGGLAFGAAVSPPAVVALPFAAAILAAAFAFASAIMRARFCSGVSSAGGASAASGAAFDASPVDAPITVSRDCPEGAFACGAA
jgi:hypothetical protein